MIPLAPVPASGADCAHSVGRTPRFTTSHTWYDGMSKGVVASFPEFVGSVAHQSRWAVAKGSGNRALMTRASTARSGSNWPSA